MLRYRTGEDVRIGDVVTTSSGNTGFVRFAVQPGTPEATELLCVGGGVLVKENVNGAPSDVMIRATDEEQWQRMTFVSRGSMFKYDTGEDIRLGDLIITGNGNPGFIKLILQPGTQESQDWSSPEGGILVEEDWNGQTGLYVLPLCHQADWEDLTFVRRAPTPTE